VCVGLGDCPGVTDVFLCHLFGLNLVNLLCCFLIRILLFLVCSYDIMKDGRGKLPFWLVAATSHCFIVYCWTR
jgi:hypothetical protein